MRRTVLLLAACAALVSLPLAATAAEAYDWSDPHPHRYRAGWTIGPCVGSDIAPLACVSRRGSQRGVIEATAIPLSVLPPGTDAEVLDFLAGEILAAAADFGAGCEGWEFVAHPVRTRVVGFAEGRAVEFSLRSDGRFAQMQSYRLGIQGDHLHFTSIDVASDLACNVDPDFGALTPTEWRTFERAYDRLAATSIFHVFDG